eukprot:TRINITY_DN21191_c0_g1_i1.p6 TRINITY_DN21191_c0_g1~~TRINITY_DN21191_c0_g1_i1.p6  ORF type:complete len:126 (-),score=18.57 TRINITY_DN21191_c0_g1_i1:483-860(-)
MIPDRKKDFLNLIIKARDFIGFVNLNEFELSETNMDKVTKKYKLNEGGYVIRESKKAGIQLLRELKKKKNQSQGSSVHCRIKKQTPIQKQTSQTQYSPTRQKNKRGACKISGQLQKTKYQRKILL